MVFCVVLEHTAFGANRINDDKCDAVREASNSFFRSSTRSISYLTLIRITQETHARGPTTCKENARKRETSGMRGKDRNPQDEQEEDVESVHQKNYSYTF